MDDVSGTIRGYRIFTACRTVNRKVFRIEDHIRRLYQSAAGIYMQPPCPEDELREIIEETARRNIDAAPDRDFLIEIIFSGGLIDNTMRSSGKGAHLYIAAQELHPPQARYYQEGVTLATFPHLRIFPDIKLLNYVGGVMAHQTVVPQHNAFDVIYVDPTDGDTVLEGSTFTVFFIDRPDRVVTPPLNGRILDSITRRVIMEILTKRPDIEIAEAPVRLSELKRLQEAFLASTTRNVVPVTRVDDRIIGDGRPGPTTEKVAGLFLDYLSSY